MKKWKRAVALTPGLGRVALFSYRARTAVGYHNQTMRKLLRWLATSSEATNHTYRLEPDNIKHLAALISHITNVEYATVMRYIGEIDEDEALMRHVVEATISSPLSKFADPEVRLGRRIGWYVFARIVKPKVVVETGVDKGLGACVLTAALMRNKIEGFEGRYIGTDIDPDAGYLLSGKFADYGEIIYGDSIATLGALDVMIDLFINDSDHSTGYEAREYETIASKLTKRAIILGDNSHCSDALLDFSLGNNRHFVFFAERPADHWYPGAGIGISFCSDQALE